MCTHLQGAGLYEPERGCIHAVGERNTRVSVSAVARGCAVVRIPRARSRAGGRHAAQGCLRYDVNHGENVTCTTTSVLTVVFSPRNPTYLSDCNGVVIRYQVLCDVFQRRSGCREVVRDASIKVMRLSNIEYIRKEPLSGEHPDMVLWPLSTPLRRAMLYFDLDRSKRQQPSQSVWKGCLRSVTIKTMVGQLRSEKRVNREEIERDSACISLWRKHSACIATGAKEEEPFGNISSRARRNTTTFELDYSFMLHVVRESDVYDSIPDQG